MTKESNRGLGRTQRECGQNDKKSHSLPRI